MTFTRPYFLPEVMLKFMKSVIAHFVMFIESGMQIIMWISGHISLLLLLLVVTEASHIGEPIASHCECPEIVHEYFMVVVEWNNSRDYIKS